MAATKTSLRQIVHRDKLDQLTTDALYQAAPAGGKPTGSTEADNLLTSVNSELTNPLRLYPTDPTADRVVHVGAITVVNPETAKNRIATMINKAMPAFTGATITLPSTANGASNIVVSVGDDIINYDQTASTFVKCCVWLNDIGEVVLSFGSEGASAALAGTPDFEKKTQFLGYFVIETDASQNIQNIEFADIFQVEGGGSGGGGLDKWEPSVKYTVDDVVWYSVDRNVYVCITEHTSTGTFDETKFELLSNDGYSITLGETIAVGEAIYISKGTANGDTGRTQSYAYKLDITNANRCDYAGICIYGGDASDVGIISVSGNIKGFTGLTGGQLVYASSTAGGWSHSKPSVLGYKIIILGMAVDTTHLLINGGLSSSSETYTLSTEDANTIHLITSDDLTIVSDIDLQGNNASFDGGGTITASSLTLSTTAADLLKSVTKVIKYLPAANGQNDYFGFTKAIPQGSRGRYLGLQFEYRTDSTTVDSDFRLCVKQKDGTNVGNIQYFNIDAAYNANGAGKTFKEAAYIMDDCTEIEFGWQNTVTTTTVELYVDNILITNSAFKDTKLIEKESARFVDVAGQGSTNTKIPYFTTEVKNSTGNIVSISNSAVNGLSITAFKNCSVSVSFSGSGSDMTYHGWSLNSNQLTTGIVSITTEHRLSSDYAVNDEESTSSAFIEMEAGDVLRPHGEGGAANARGVITILAQAEVDGVVHSGSGDSETVFYQDGAGAGSTNTKIPYFTNEIRNTASSLISVENSPVNGFSITAKQPCTVTMNTAWFTSTGSLAGVYYGISLNSTELTTNIQSITAAHRLVFTKFQGPAAEVVPISVEVHMSPGDVLRPHKSEISTYTEALNYVMVTAKPTARTIITPITQTCYIEDVKATTVDSGSMTGGAYNTRDLNTLSGDTSFVTLSANQFTLGAGKYKLLASAPATGVNSHKAALYDITNAAYIKYGTSMQTDGTSETSRSEVRVMLTLTETTTFELRHHIRNHINANDGGESTDDGSDERYSFVEITKLKS
jgi:hypothetical protein